MHINIKKKNWIWISSETGAYSPSRFLFMFRIEKISCHVMHIINKKISSNFLKNIFYLEINENNIFLFKKTIFNVNTSKKLKNIKN